MSGAEAVLALVLVEWAGGLLGAAGWTQSWSVVRRGHFKIVGWTSLAFAIGGYLAFEASATEPSFARPALIVVIVCAVLYVAAQYVRTEMVGAVVGIAGGLAACIALVGAALLLPGWTAWLAALGLLAGLVLLGGVTNGMLLGHWYLNQPGLKPWALGRLTDATLAGIVVAVVLGVVSAGKLANASTEGAVLGLPGFGESFSTVFFIAWLAIAALTAGVVWMARRCVKIKSIQSATGLFYVALLTAGVSEFLVRYLMVNA
ncbi:MAG: hypothetical protein KY391_04650 [Actinobacteria bacterium]|nr:hypothetical protein [Actinomycetota bacterium]